MAPRSILQERHQPHGLQELHRMSATMLTAQQVQQLLDVDASTVYRMAGDGRLPAVRIGKQWRFPADAIEALLVPRAGDAMANGAELSAAPGASPDDRPAPTTRPPGILPPPGIATAALEAIAPALGVSMVVTDLGGRPMTAVVNPAPMLASQLGDPEFALACTAEWRGFADEPHLAPRLRPGRFGFLCAHALVRHGTSLVAMVLAGGIAPEGHDAPDLFHLDADRQAAVVETLPRTAALLSRLMTDGHHAIA